MNNPIESFFKLGEKVTKNDPVRKADFDFYLMTIMFLAFLSIGIGNFVNFIRTQQIAYLGWSVVMIAILWFQYFGLAQMWQFRKMIRTNNKEAKEIKIDPVDEMLKEFTKDA